LRFRTEGKICLEKIISGLRKKNTDGSSVLYPLTDFKGLNRISSLQKAYKFGKFGAVPNL